MADSSALPLSASNNNNNNNNNKIINKKHSIFFNKQGVNFIFNKM